MAKVAIDAGADVVYGHHPHVLQPIEQYGSGYIFYSMGNFSFGGAALPQDYDTVLLQLDVIRDENGRVRLGELTAIPCSYKSDAGQNSFQPTPVEEGATYDRILKKLGGEFTGGNLNVDYGKLEPKPTPTTPPAPVAPAPDSGSSDSGSDNTSTPDSGSSGSSSDTSTPDTGSSGSGSDTSTPDTGSSSGSSDSSSSDSGSSSGGSDTSSSDSGSSSGSSDSGASSSDSSASSDGSDTVSE